LGSRPLNLAAQRSPDKKDVYGNSYTEIDEVYERYKNEITLVIKNDDGEPTWYDHMRFVPKNEFREHIINDILKK